MPNMTLLGLSGPQIISPCKPLAALWLMMEPVSESHDCVTAVPCEETCQNIVLASQLLPAASGYLECGDT